MMFIASDDSICSFLDFLLLIYLLVFLPLLYISIMAEYKDSRGNTSRGRGVMSFRDRGLSSRDRVFGRGQNNSQKCTHCNRTNHTIRRYWELHGNPSWPSRAAYLSGTAVLSTAHDSNIFDTSADEFVTIKI